MTNAINDPDVYCHIVRGFGNTVTGDNSSNVTLVGASDVFVHTYKGRVFIVQGKRTPRWVRVCRAWNRHTTKLRKDSQYGDGVLFGVIGMASGLLAVLFFALGMMI